MFADVYGTYNIIYFRKSCGNHVSDIIQNKPTNIHILCRFDSYSMNIEIRNDCYTVLMTDTAGQEEYDRLRPLGYPGVGENIKYWRNV